MVCALTAKGERQAARTKTPHKQRVEFKAREKNLINLLKPYTPIKFSIEGTALSLDHHFLSDVTHTGCTHLLHDTVQLGF